MVVAIIAVIVAIIAVIVFGGIRNITGIVIVGNVVPVIVIVGNVVPAIGPSETPSSP